VLSKGTVEHCYGVLHASGARTVADLSSFSKLDFENMGVTSEDVIKINNIISEARFLHNEPSILNPISTKVSGAFVRPPPWPWVDTEARKVDLCDFRFKEIQLDIDDRILHKSNAKIVTCRLFTPEQCQQLSRMAEYHAYAPSNEGWNSGIYTLTKQHMVCNEVPTMLTIIQPLMRRLTSALYSIFPTVRYGSLEYENDGEPHLVKYCGFENRGTDLHTDRFSDITINVALSDPDDFKGGGTYIKTLDRTIFLEQGEVLIHLGCMVHSGVDITSGVRNILVAFMKCDWDHDEFQDEGFGRQSKLWTHGC
jgi:hypothetical protein